MPVTTNPVYATGDTIEAVIVNNLNDSVVVLDGRTGGDPGGSNKWLVSSSSTDAAWVARATAVLAAIGYTPVNRAGDTGMAGTFSGATDIQWGPTNQRSTQSTNLNNITRAGWYYADNAASNTPTGSFCALVHLQTPGTSFAAQIAHAGSDGSLWVRVNPGAGWLSWARIWTSGNDGSGSGLAADTAVTATSATSATTATTATTANGVADGAVSTTAKLADGIVTTAKLADLNVTSGKLATDAVTTAKIATGAVTTDELGAGVVTSAKLGASAVENVNILNGAVDNNKLASGAAAANLGYTPARMVSSTYTGNGGGSRAITGLGFTPLLVIVHSTAASGPTALILGDTEAPTILVGAGSAATTGTALASGQFTVPAAFNASGVTYRYLAIG